MARNKLNHKIEVGDFSQDIIRHKPDRKSFMNWQRSMFTMPELKDYDVYLYGTFPNKPTWDVDVMLNNGSGKWADTEELEKIFYNNLNVGLKDNNIFVDMNYDKGNPRRVSQEIDHYMKNKGNFRNWQTQVYGSRWNVNGKTIRDRYSEGSENMGNNIWKKDGQMPTNKMLDALKYPGTIDRIYGDKPMLLKPRNKIYGMPNKRNNSRIGVRYGS